MTKDMPDLAGLLAGQVEPGVYRWVTAKPETTGGAERSPLAIAEAAQRAGWRLFWLDGRAADGKESFLAACAETFDLPGWFGHNWDALDDCLTDLSWVPAKAGHLVVYDGWDTLAAGDSDAFATALAVFEDTVEHWRDTSTPMAVLLPAECGDLPFVRLSLAG